MKLIDTHFHLDYYRNHKYWYEQINALNQYTLCVTNSPEVHHSCIRLYPETKYIKFAVGYNPQMCVDIKFSEESFLYELLKTKYIGEVGLDFSKRFEDYHMKQIEIFEFICHCAASQNKVMSVHSRGAEEEVLRILKKYNVKKAILHWYSGKEKTLEQFIEEGYYFSINSNMCETEKGRKIIKCIPYDKLLVESDGPFTKINSNKFSPNLLYSIYGSISNILHEDDVSALIWRNFNDLLSL